MKKKKRFNSFKEYMEHLIYEKDALNMKNILIAIVIIGVIAILSLQLSKSLNRDFDWFKGNTINNEHMKETLIQAGYSLEEVNAMSEDKLISLFNNILLSNKSQQAGNKKYKEYPEQDAALLKQDYYLKASKGNFNEIITDFDNKKLEYNFSASYNKDLITIYNDAYYLKTVIGNQYKPDEFKIKEVLSNIKDAQMLVYGTLLTDEKYRRDTYIDSFSLSPVLVKQEVSVTSVYSTSMLSINNLKGSQKDTRFIEMANYLNEGDYIFYRIGFTIDKNPLKAYIYKNVDGFKLSFYGMYSDTSETPYLTAYQHNQNNISNSTIVTHSNNQSNISTEESNSSVGENNTTDTNTENGNLTGNDTENNEENNNETTPGDESNHDFESNGEIHLD